MSDYLNTHAERQTEITENLYKIPWTAYNNANGWIEPTSACQLKCPGCFRGVCEENYKPKNLKLDDLKKEVDFFLEKRNVQHISIGGGEALLYPHLDELIAYITSKGLNAMLFTNGLLLDKQRLIELKKVGLNKISVHIDKYQKRNGITDEVEANKLRDKFCELFREVGGVKLGFIMSISKHNIDDLEIIAPFMIKNSDIVDLVTFTVYKEMLPAKQINPGLTYPYEELIGSVRQAFDLNFSAYLGKKLSSQISWIYATTIYRNGKPKGSLSPETYRNIQERNLQDSGKYLFAPENKWSQQMIELGYNHQTVVLINGPDHTEHGWDLCDGCPDSMYVDGKLVPSCLLERVKGGEDIQVRDIEVK
jgi:pyruvate-formate lyase-activating enzyme